MSEIDEIRKRHKAGVRASAVEDRGCLLNWVKRLRVDLEIERIRLKEHQAEVERMRAKMHEMRDALIEWDGLIEHQYSGSRDAMSDMQYAALRTAQLLDDLDIKENGRCATRSRSVASPQRKRPCCTGRCFVQQSWCMKVYLNLRPTQTQYLERKKK